MISFSKSAEHFNDGDSESVYISTDGQSLEEITKAFNKFLVSCGFQVATDDDAFDAKKKDFYI